MSEWRTKARRVLLDHGEYLVVEEHTIELSDGRLIDNWPWIVTPDYVNVVAITPERVVVCLRQNKYAIDGLSLAPIAGFIEPSEEPLAAAKRELAEEAGFGSDRWTSLGSYVVDGNRGAGNAHLFLAEGCRPVARPASDDLEDQEVILLSYRDFRMAVTSGQFKVLPWAPAASLALVHMLH